MKNLMSLAVFALFFVVQTDAAMAADGSSGCGMGWEIAPKQSLMSSSTRSYVNATFSSTIAMTSGTSGCQKHSIVQNEMKAIHYAESNHGELMIEMAQGQGEHLRGLAAVVGCPAMNTQSFGSAIQSSYPQIFSKPDTSPAEVLQGVRSVIQSRPELSAQCGTEA